MNEKTPAFVIKQVVVFLLKRGSFIADKEIIKVKT